jgi:hypothetical protein
MIRISTLTVVLLTLAATAGLGASAAFAQGSSVRGGSAVDRCIAKCKQQGTWKICDKWCEDRYSQYTR